MKGKTLLNGILLAGMLTLVLSAGGCVAPTGTPGTAAPTSNPAALIIVLALMIAMFYFLMIRPFRQREKKHDEMVMDLAEGDTVITAGGMMGEVERIDEDSIVLKVESGALVRITKGGVLSKRGPVQSEQQK